MIYLTDDLETYLKNPEFIYLGGDDDRNPSLYPWENFLIWHQENNFPECKILTKHRSRYGQFVSDERFLILESEKIEENLEHGKKSRILKEYVQIRN